MSWSDWIGSLYDFLGQAESFQGQWPAKFGEQCLAPLQQNLNCVSIALLSAPQEQEHTSQESLIWQFPNSLPQPLTHNPLTPSFPSFATDAGDIFLCTGAEEFPQSNAYSAIIGLSKSYSLTLVLTRCAEAGPFNDRSQKTLTMVTEHLCRVVRLIEQMDIFVSRQQLHYHILERWQTGVVLLNGAGELQYTNAAARNIFDQNTDIEASSKGIRCRDRTVNTNLKQAIEIAIDAATDGDLIEPLVLRLALAETELAVIITIPSALDSIDYWQAETTCILLIEDLNHTISLEQDYLKLRYRLTQRESQVALELINGASTAEIALKHFVSEETVRKQSKSIRKKANVTSYTELSRLLTEAGHHAFVPPDS